MQFFAQTSHELRTPLNAIVGFAEMMVQQVFGALPEKYLEYARLIREGGRNLNAVVDDITDLAKIEAGKFEIAPEVVSLTDLLEEAVRFLSETAERKRVALTLDAKEDVEAFADPRAVRQIALNLISNALKFTPAGGQVTVSATESAAGSRLTVADNGVGVTPEEIRELSQAFRQGRAGRSHKGSGLGLSVVRAYVELHSGEFTISGRPERGTVVSVTFPPETGESSSGGDSRST
jgi:signal transduction histidine kinase